MQAKAISKISSSLALFCQSLSYHVIACNVFNVFEIMQTCPLGSNIVE